MAALASEVSDRLRAVVGDRLNLSEAVRTAHGRSESHFETVLPDAVAFPHSTEEVVALVRACVAAEVPIIPFGAGTSIEGNTTPVRGGLTIDLSEMNRIVAVNPEDFDCTVEAGVRREQLNEHLRDQGLFFPIDPGANATIGGMAATRASGTNAVRYGTMREAVLSLRVVTPDGKDVRTARRARKSAAGYDLTRLMIGSEGTLGIITEVTLRLHGIPETISAAVCGFETLDGAVATVVQAIQLGVPLARVEILDDVQMRAVNRWSKLDYPEVTTLFFEFHGFSRRRWPNKSRRCRHWQPRTAAANSLGRTGPRNARGSGRLATKPTTPPSACGLAASVGRLTCACRSAAWRSVSARDQAGRPGGSLAYWLRSWVTLATAISTSCS